jgi:hypothetical protein
MRTLLTFAVATWLLAGCPADEEAPSGTTDGGSVQHVAGQGAGSSGSAAGATGAGSGAGSSGGGVAGNGSSTAGISGTDAGHQVDAAVTGDAAVAASDCALPCEAGTHCELVQVQCIQAPCPPLPQCVADAADGGSVDCDQRKIMCRVKIPPCPDMQVPSIDGTCYGACVPIESCACDEAAACPDASQYTCHMSAGRCGPYVN